MKMGECSIKDEYVVCKPDDSLLKYTDKIRRSYFAIVTKDKKPVGIVTQNDVLRKVLGKKMDIKKVKMKDIMSKPLVTASVNDDIKKITKIMVKKNFLSIPVVDKSKKLLGVVTLFDALRMCKMKK
ncbi:MAG: CBS domain-containing protein [Candidatus Aenigmarchaeota archaeon]|nr:CBS domain-containing protein [Candidatus Aenigmarchaeota archaeon]